MLFLIIIFSSPLALLLGWVLDLAFGDPVRLPHPVVAMGRLISFGEHRLNRGSRRRLKGGLWAVFCIVLTYLVAQAVVCLPLALVWSLQVSLRINHWVFCLLVALYVLVQAVLVFYCLAGHTLRAEVEQTFKAVDRSLDEGRRQVARIVGRDTSALSAQEIRTAALETLAENLSDGVVAPLFWLALLGVPGMLAYKMVNTLDSMIGYRNERYREFGCVAAHIDDVANYVPARLTAFVVALIGRLVYGRKRLFSFVMTYGPRHLSPNSGWPEAAFAGLLDCRFGGTHDYFGQRVEKPYIGSHERPLTTADMRVALRVSFVTECIVLSALVLSLATSVCIRLWGF